MKWTIASRALLTSVPLLAACHAEPADWLRRYPAPSELSLAAGGEGKILLAGGSWAPVDLGGGALPLSGDHPLFAAALDAAGEHVWSARIGTSRTTHVVAVAPSGDGGMAVAMQGQPLAVAPEFGSYWGLAVVEGFDASGARRFRRSFGDEEQVTLPGPGEGVSALPSGNTAWIGGMAPGPNGAVVIAGLFTGTIDFGTGPLAGGQAATFVVSLDGEGQTIFATAFPILETTDSFDGPLPLAVDASGAVTLVFGTHEKRLRNLDASGVERWTRRLASVSIEAIAAGDGGEVTLAGSLYSATDITSDTPDYSVPSSRVLARFDAQGELLWQRRPDALDLTVNALVPAPSGELILAGAFNGAIDLGSGALSPSSDVSGYLARLAVDGSPRWSRSVGDTRMHWATGAGIAPDGGVIVGGHYQGPPGGSGIFVQTFAP